MAILKQSLATLVLLGTLIGPQLTFASGGAARVDVYADMAKSACSLSDVGIYPPVLFVYYFFNGPDTGTLVRFRATKPASWTNATWAGDTSPDIAIGSTQSDWSAAFGACLHTPVYVGKTAYVIAGAGGQTACATITAQAPLGGFEFVWVDCNFAEFPLVSGSSVAINPNASCPCQLPVATQPTSWGRVKSLYR
jgi:hypothetical protein